MTKIQENELSESAVRLQENRKCDIRKFENLKLENSNEAKPQQNSDD